MRCSVHFTIYMYLYLYSYRRETARQLRMYAQLTRCFSAAAELLVMMCIVTYIAAAHKFVLFPKIPSTALPPQKNVVGYVPGLNV